MRAILDTEILTDGSVLNPGEPGSDDGVHQEKPASTQEKTQRPSRQYLGGGMIPQVDSGVHDCESKRPWQQRHKDSPKLISEVTPPSDQQRAVHGEEAHILRMTGGPAVGIAHLQRLTCQWPCFVS